MGELPCRASVGGCTSSSSSSAATAGAKAKAKAGAGALAISNLEGVRHLNDDVIHVHGFEGGEALGQRDELVGVLALVVLSQASVSVQVWLPPPLSKLLLQLLVAGDGLVGGQVH